MISRDLRSLDARKTYCVLRAYVIPPNRETTLNFSGWTFMGSEGSNSISFCETSADAYILLGNADRMKAPDATKDYRVGQFALVRLDFIPMHKFTLHGKG